MDKATSENGIEEVQLLPFHDDEHEGIIVEMKEPMDPDDFSVILRYSLSQWKLQEKKGVWIKLPIQLVNLVEIAVKEGFLYHHAEPHYLMLVYWIPETLSTIPANATHRLRIGAIIMDDKREGEDICSGARREVKEETGIDTEFMNVLAFSGCQLLNMQLSLFPQKYSIFKHAADICLAKVDKGYAGFSPVPVTSSINGQISHLYVNKEDLNL
ncbi:UNVERIFIED_CONTAM: Nudix hydrolase 10 [Sesamum radiatum]|uniref:Nudix hydrolase 10 n=1 Tax=Sesamum radiatum TaxID=300843 RepID=A0AAW2KHC1_SESRA